jgi:hypothetical protein
VCRYQHIDDVQRSLILPLESNVEEYKNTQTVLAVILFVKVMCPGQSNADIQP